MNPTISRKEQLVIDIITIKTCDDKIWQKMRYEQIEEEVRYIERADQLAMMKLPVQDRLQSQVTHSSVEI